MAKRRLGRRIVVYGALGLAVAAGVGAIRPLRALWARRALVGNFRRVQQEAHSGRSINRVIRAAEILAEHPCARHDQLSAEALATCQFHMGRCCCNVDVEMPVLCYLAPRLCEGSAVARSACLGYLDASAEFVQCSAKDDKDLCASMVDQQNLLVHALERAGDDGGLPAARKLSTSGVPLGVIEAVEYIGQFGDESDMAVLETAGKRMERSAPPEVRPIALHAVRWARAEIAARQ